MEVHEDMLEPYREICVPDDEEEEDKELALELLMYSGRQAAVAFRDSLISFAVQWYQGEALEDSDSEDVGREHVLNEEYSDESVGSDEDPF